MNETASLFDAVVDASGLMAMIAPFTVSRLLISAGLSPNDLTREELRRALPELERGLAVYLDEEQLREATGNLRRLASG